MDLKTIVVGVDGSQDSRAAVEWAADLAVVTHAQVIAVHALGLVEHIGSEKRVVPVETHKEEITRAFEVEWCAPLGARRTSYRAEVMYGSPVPVLLKAAGAFHADLLVVGSRGIGGFPGLLLGSTSSQLIQHAPCPVTVIPHLDKPCGAQR